jgi:hypothetical protein
LHWSEIHEGQSLYERGDEMMAECRRNVARAEEVLGRDNLTYARALDTLARALAEVTSQEYGECSREILQEDFVAVDEDMTEAEVDARLEEMFAKEDEGFVEVLDLLNQAAEASSRFLGGNQTALASVASQLMSGAYFMKFYGRYSAAVDLLERAIVTYERLDAYGANDPITLDAKLDLTSFRQHLVGATSRTSTEQQRPANELGANKIIYEDYRRRLGPDNEATRYAAGAYVAALLRAKDYVMAAEVALEKLRADCRTSRDEMGRVISRIELDSKCDAMYASDHLANLENSWIMLALCALFESGDHANGRRIYQAALTAADSAMRHSGVRDGEPLHMFNESHNHRQFHKFAVSFALFGAESAEHVERLCLNCNRECHVDSPLLKRLGGRQSLRAVTAGVLAIALYRQRIAFPHKVAEAVKAFQSVPNLLRPEGYLGTDFLTMDGDILSIPHSLMWFSTPEYSALQDAAKSSSPT